MHSASPVADAERLPALDVLRGFAVLGILVMNVGVFAMPLAAYYNPYALGEPSTRDLTIWSITHVLADQKFMTIFSLLFGAGVLLMTTRAADRGAAAVWVHYRRMGWLLAFGLVHAYLLWHGDILVLYAVCGMLVYPARRLRPVTLLVLGLCVLSVGTLNATLAGLSMAYWPPEAAREFQIFWRPEPAQLRDEVAAFSGPWSAQWTWRARYSLDAHTADLLYWGVWRAGGLMLLGMALHKWGVLGGTRAPGFYRTLSAAGFGAGLPLVGWGLFQHHATGWNVRDSFFLVSQWNYWGSLLVSLGWIGLLVTVWRAGAAGALVTRLAAVGRMAFTCYILQTLIGTTVFYGHGIGLFGRVDRLGQMLFTAAVWMLLLIAAPMWLARFRFGPLEWLWRTLTYGRVEPIRRPAAGGAAV